MTRRWNWLNWSSLIVLSLGLLWLAYLAMDNKRLDDAALTAVGALAAAIATAVAAMAALRAAQQSNATARDAMEALGLAMQPTLDGSFMLYVIGELNGTREEYRAVIENKSNWSAMDVEVEARLSDGRSCSEHFERIGPATSNHPGLPIEPTRVFILIPGGPKTPTSEPVDGEKLRFVDQLILRFSDERRALRWEQNIQYIHETGRDGPITSGSSECHSSLLRIR